MPSSPPDVAVLGGGVVGLTLAWTLRRRDVPVTVYDDAPARGTSWVAAGMLAPGGEAWFGEDVLVRLGMASLARWPATAAALEQDAGQAPGLRTDGTLLVAVTEDDARAQERLRTLMSAHGIGHRLLRRREARALEPALHPHVQAVTEVPGDHSVNNRTLLAALLAACARRGVRVVDDRADVVVDARAVRGVRTRRDARTHGHDVVVVASGVDLRDVDGVPDAVRRSVRPTKGEILRVGSSQPVLTRTVRADVRGRPVYLVPRADGEIVVGATSTERGYDTGVDVDAVHALLHDAVEVVPELRDATFLEAASGLRPSTPDHLPLVGPSGVDGLLLAAGHHRGGVLLAPWTAEAITALVSGDPPPDGVGLVDPRRFAADLQEV